jgi:GT2 family glycosyltransferase
MPIKRAKVIRVSLEHPLAPIDVDARYGHVLLVVTLGGVVVGELLVPTPDVASPQRLREVIEAELGERVWRERLRSGFAALGPQSIQEPNADQAISIVVCTGDPALELASLLQAVSALESPPEEVIVVERPPPDSSVSQLCSRHGALHLREPSGTLARARNRGIGAARGELIALVDGVSVEPSWLNGLEAAFADPLVMAVTGYTGPSELETPAQCLAALRADLGEVGERRVYDAFTTARPRLDGGNCTIRRAALAEVGPFADFLGQGTQARGGLDEQFCARLLAAGYRVIFDPSRIAWRRPPRSDRRLAEVLFDRAAGAHAQAAERLFLGRDPNALFAPSSRWRSALGRELRRLVARDERRLPPALLATEVMGAFAGPLLLARSLAEDRAAAQEPLRPAPERSVPVRIAAADDPPLTVAIASHNRCDRLAEVLRALANQTYPAERYAVVLVLDGSTDGSTEMARSLELPYELRLIEQENRGLAASRNRGAGESETAIVIFLDDDVVPERVLLAEHAAAHRGGDETVVALGPYPPARRKGEDLQAVVTRLWWEDYFRRRAQPGHVWTYMDFADGNASMRRDLILDSGGWDEDFVRGTVRRQDWEFAIRLLERGAHFAHCADARAQHHIDSTLETALRNRRVEGRSDVLLGTRHPAVRGHLVLAGMMRRAAESRSLSRALATVYRRPAASERVLRCAVPVARALEGTQLRPLWRELTGRMASLSYLLGVREALPSPAQLREFIQPALSRSGVPSVPVWLDEPDGIDVPAIVGPVELAIGLAGRRLTSIDAPPPESQWDWEEIGERVAREAPKPLKEALGSLPVIPLGDPAS